MSTRKLSAAQRGYSPRDFKIYVEVAIERYPQEVVAKRHGLTQGRVSQIWRKVRDALAAAEPEDNGELAAVREERAVERECQARREHYLTLASEAFRESSQPLVTTKTRLRGGVEEYVDATVKPQRANVQLLKLMVKLNGEIEAGGEVRGRRSESRGHRVAGGERSSTPAGGGSLRSSPATPDQAPPPTPPVNNSPAEVGRRRARGWLAEVVAGTLSLSEAESLTHLEGMTDGAEYPSYFEKSAEDINGVRVADWVREYVPDERLPHGEDLWLPLDHNMEDFDAEGREVLEHDNSQRIFNPSRVGWHYGRKRSEVSGQKSGRRGQESGGRSEVGR